MADPRSDSRSAGRLLQNGRPAPQLQIHDDRLHGHRFGLRHHHHRRHASGLEHHQQRDGQHDQHHPVAEHAQERLDAPLRAGTHAPRSGQRQPVPDGPHLPVPAEPDPQRGHGPRGPHLRGEDARKPAQIRRGRPRQPRIRHVPLEPALLQLSGAEPDQGQAHHQQRHARNQLRERRPVHRLQHAGDPQRRIRQAVPRPALRRDEQRDRLLRVRAGPRRQEPAQAGGFAARLQRRAQGDQLRRADQAYRRPVARLRTALRGDSAQLRERRETAQVDRRATRRVADLPQQCAVHREAPYDRQSLLAHFGGRSFPAGAHRERRDALRPSEHSGQSQQYGRPAQETGRGDPQPAGDNDQHRQPAVHQRGAFDQLDRGGVARRRTARREIAGRAGGHETAQDRTRRQVHPLLARGFDAQAQRPRDQLLGAVVPLDPHGPQHGPACARKTCR